MRHNNSFPQFENENALRRVLSQSMTLIQQHHVCPIDVVHFIGIHRHQNAPYVSLEKKNKKLKKERKNKNKTSRDIFYIFHTVHSLEYSLMDVSEFCAGTYINELSFKSFPYVQQNSLFIHFPGQKQKSRYI